MIKHCLLLLMLVSGTVHAFSMSCPRGQAAITGFAQSFVTDARIKHAHITALETGKVYTTDANGRFFFCQPIGSHITLLLEKKGFHPLQTATYRVLASGFKGPYRQITFQVPTNVVYHMIKLVISKSRKVSLDPGKCTLVTTIAAYHKTLADDLQGEPGAVLTVEDNNNRQIPVVTHRPYYFGFFKYGPFKGKTNIFTSGLTKTTRDGGVLVYNLEVQSKDHLYTLSAVKPGKTFTRINIWCRAGALINVSPPWSPTVTD